RLRTSYDGRCATGVTACDARAANEPPGAARPGARTTPPVRATGANRPQSIRFGPGGLGGVGANPTGVPSIENLQSGIRAFRSKLWRTNCLAHSLNRLAVASAPG